ncbi:hypothetical protein [Pseudocitrobacter cyperus]|uniref:Uncharacterized protein n=1 Tax=Pseudocitrobacter cyperus TaxID=3112843 RepID=A0ABV0HN11_9ENTR
MKKLFFITVLLALSSPAVALNFNSTVLKLKCPSRGLIEITLHAFGHISELWKGHYYVGSGHEMHNGMEYFKFSNGDTLMHHPETDKFTFYFAKSHKLKACKKLSEHPIKVAFN